jgi:hypothetical protein
MIIEQFIRLYQDLDKSNIDSIDSIYAPEIQFNDPFHQVDGLINLKAYFYQLYINVESIDFTFGESLSDNDNHFIQWTMTLKHPKLNGGKSFAVQGASLLKVNSDQQIIFHRDYFDAGVMLYEQLPILGGLVKLIKRRV